MTTLNLEPIVDAFDVVWCGAMKHVTLGAALKGVEPFEGHEVEGPGPVAQDRWAQPTGKMIMQLLRDHGPMSQAQLVLACHRDHHDVRKALRRKALKGEVVLVQPTLLDMLDAQPGQLWRTA